MSSITYDGVDAVRQECIDMLVKAPQDFSTEDIAEIYCVMTGRELDDFEVDAKTGHIRFMD